MQSLNGIVVFKPFSHINVVVRFAHCFLPLEWMLLSYIHASPGYNYAIGGNQGLLPLLPLIHSLSNTKPSSFTMPSPGKHPSLPFLEFLITKSCHNCHVSPTHLLIHTRDPMGMPHVLMCTHVSTTWASPIRIWTSISKMNPTHTNITCLLPFVYPTRREGFS